MTPTHPRALAARRCAYIVRVTPRLSYLLRAVEDALAEHENAMREAQQAGDSQRERVELGKVDVLRDVLNRAGIGDPVPNPWKDLRSALITPRNREAK